MNTIRGAMSVFLLAIPTVCFFGWRWTAALPAPKLMAARTVLVLAALAALVALSLIWRVKPRKAVQ
jgi:hypothetical protein